MTRFFWSLPGPWRAALMWAQLAGHWPWASMLPAALLIGASGLAVRIYRGLRTP